MKGKPRKAAPKRLFKNRDHVTGAGLSHNGTVSWHKDMIARDSRKPILRELSTAAPQGSSAAGNTGGQLSWLPPPRTEEDRCIMATHIRVPGLEAGQARCGKCAFHRYVYPAEKMVLQFAALLFMAGDVHAPEYPNGVPIPAELRDQMPRLEGRQEWLMTNTRQVPWFAGFYHRMCDIAMAECSYGIGSSAELVPDVAVLALDDDRVVGYACGGCTPRNVLFIQSEPGHIDRARIAMMRESPSLKVPYVSIVWTAANYRRSGIARLLVEDIAKALHVTPQGLAYETPFSPEGLRLVQHCAGLKFMASTAQLMMAGVPIEHEDCLTECHDRIVVEEADSEALQRMQERMAEMGYSAGVRRTTSS